MRLRRPIEGELGPVQDAGWIPVIPPRWRLPVLIATAVLCAAMFVTALLLGLHRV
ncbi:MAG: hypothetical protein JOY80_05970 [Candidatus Dormibacteraeota bacterium]|nr:hypothetical protein [Candidatus Dormibacteraeota bacterium]